VDYDWLKLLVEKIRNIF